MPTWRVTLLVEWAAEGEPGLPLLPVAARREGDGWWRMDFDVEADTFDRAAGQLWGEAAACGLRVQVACSAA